MLRRALLLRHPLFRRVALLQGARMWPVDPEYAPTLPTAAVGYAALWTPAFATWAMPTDRSLIIYPLTVIALWFAAGSLGPYFIAAPPEGRALCGMPLLFVMIVGLCGLFFGVLGRAIGLSVRDRLNSAALTYLVQLIPFGSAFALVTLISH